VKRFITATDVRRAASCLHSWTLACHGDPAARRKPTAGEERLFAKGMEEERSRVASLPELATVEWDGMDWEAGQRATVELMRRGCRWIYQAVLARDDLRGRPDLLQRVEGESGVGSWTYEPADVKWHREPTKADRYQLAFYALQLEPILGRVPAKLRVWANDGTLHEIAARPSVRAVRALIEKMRAIRDAPPATVGARCGLCRLCLWSDHCKAGWLAAEDVTLLPGVTGQTAERMRAAGFVSWRLVAEDEPRHLAQALDMAVEKAEDLQLLAQAWRDRRPVLRRQPERPAPDRGVVFYDVETYGEVVYLHGAIRLCGTEREERQFMADRPEDEARVWHEYLEWLAEDASRAPLVWQWTKFEEGHATRLWREHGGNAVGWEFLSRGLRDMKEWVKSSLALPVTTYSIKEVAPVFGFRWTAGDANGLSSQAWYEEWLRTRDAGLREKILRYNLDDVRAMEVVEKELRMASEETGA